MKCTLVVDEGPCDRVAALHHGCEGLCGYAAARFNRCYAAFNSHCRAACLPRAEAAIIDGYLAVKSCTVAMVTEETPMHVEADAFLECAGGRFLP